ncbi:hypothetical protein VNI00_004480 [Paramarasmius palmivorus]|uniref:Uncharacterized protein n=1 Tax=Paramarasmius palmivorus TaxID=297713 RepID=A0AAW0DFD4_9AGAR
MSAQLTSTSTTKVVGVDTTGDSLIEIKCVVTAIIYDVRCLEIIDADTPVRCAWKDVQAPKSVEVKQDALEKQFVFNHVEGYKTSIYDWDPAKDEILYKAPRTNTVPWDYSY